MVPLDSSGPMVRYVPIEETVILMCSVIVNHMKRISNTNGRLVDVMVFYPPKNIKLQPVTPLMPLEALLIPVNLTDSDSDGIGGGTGCNFIFLLCRLLVVGPVLKWLALCIYLFIYSWPHRYIFLAQIWHVAPLAPFNDHLRIRFLI